jgi:hypothetical protein
MVEGSGTIVIVPFIRELGTGVTPSKTKFVEPLSVFPIERGNDCAEVNPVVSTVTVAW